MQLRPYQRDACDAVRDAWHRGAHAVCLVAPTGSGKTVMGMDLVCGHRTLILVHTKELLVQTARRFAELGDVSCGENPFCEYQIATVQGLHSTGNRPLVERVLLDECHHFLAEEWGSVAKYYLDTPMVGLTATPERSDGRPLGDLFQEMVVAAQYPDLVADGHLVPCRVFRPGECLRSDLATEPLAAYLAHGDGKQGFLFCRSVAEAERQAELFRGAGVPAEVIEAETPEQKRQETLSRFRAGQTRILANVYVLTEGVDIPQATVCILARGVGHVSPYLQMVGRVLRPYPGKECAILIDLPGVSSLPSHGLPTEAREYSLTGRGIRRASEKSLTVCLQCGMTTHRMPCPRCQFAGFKQERAAPKIWNVELKEVYAFEQTPADAKAKELERLDELAKKKGLSMGWVAREYRRLFGAHPPELHKLDEARRKEEYGKLLKTASERGYKRGWADWRYKATFGSFPPRKWIDELASPRETQE